MPTPTPTPTPTVFKFWEDPEHCPRLMDAMEYALYTLDRWYVPDRRPVPIDTVAIKQGMCQVGSNPVLYTTAGGILNKMHRAGLITMRQVTHQHWRATITPEGKAVRDRLFLGGSHV